MRKHILKLGLMCLLVVSTLFGQSTIRIPDTTGVVGQAITVPVNSPALAKVGSVTLNISYNPQVVTFNTATGITNSPFSSTGTLLVNTTVVSATNTILNIGWFSGSPVAVTDRLMDLTFVYLGGTSGITFTGINEITDDLAQTLNSTFVSGSIGAMPTTIKLGTVVSDPNQAVSVPLTATQLDKVGSMSLFISYDPAVATFTGLTDDALGFTVDNATAGVLKLAWFDVAGYSTASGTLANLGFTFVTGSTDIKFTAGTEVTNLSAAPISVTLVNGKLSLPGTKFKIGTVRGNNGATVLVPFNAETLTNMGSFTLKLSYNKDVLEFVGTKNLVSGTISSNPGVGEVTLGYFNATGLTIANGKVFDLEFNYKGGTSAVSFATSGNEITDINSVNVTSTFALVAGQVTENAAPVFTKSIGTVSLGVGTVYEFQYAATDADDTILTFALKSGPTGLTVSAAGLLKYTPTKADRGKNYTTVVTVSDGLKTVENSATISVLQNVAPVFTSVLENKVVKYDGKAITATYAATDPDGDGVTFGFDGAAPEGATLNAASGAFSFTPLNVTAVYLIKVRVGDNLGGITSTQAEITVQNNPDIVGVEDLAIPTDFALEQNYPNPFNPTTVIRFGLPEQSNVTLRVYNLLGQEVATLLNTVKAAGWHEVNFNATSLTTGLYIYRIEAQDFSSIKKMMLVK
jgi:hypothetical protein